EVLLRRRIGETPDILEFEDLKLDVKAHTALRAARTLSLSATEYQLLHCFMSAPFQVLSKEQILDRVWGHGFHADLNLVEVYVRYLRNKMEQDGELRLIQTVRGSGYVLRTEP
ncbi:MAG: response regulator transcription factor, partial [Rectinemataceae bacterium]